MSAKLKIVSWVLLTIVGSLTLLGSLGSVYVAYVADAKIDQIGPMNLSELAEGRNDVEIALRARRGTAAAFGTGYALLFLTIVLGPSAGVLSRSSPASVGNLLRGECARSSLLSRVGN